jgi:catechol 2,3-dioxygenase-like lactoylglutathione lyase family enzyme
VSTAPLTSVDHVIVAVRDLDAAADAYGAVLGRAPAWRGTHPAHGTRNVIFGLVNSYVELLALGPGEPSSPLAAALATYLARRSEGLFGLALGTADIAAARTHLAAAGLTPTAIADGEARSDTGATRHWKSFALPRPETRGVNVFVIAHAGTGIDRSAPAAGVETAATATAVDHLVLFSDDVAGALRLWRETLGVPERWQREIPERGTVNVGLKLGGVTIELVAPLGNTAGERGERLWGAAYVVGDCDAAVARLRERAIPVSDGRAGLAPRTRVATVKWPDRVPTLLIQRL